MALLLLLCIFVPFLRIGTYVFPLSYFVIGFTGIYGFIIFLKSRANVAPIVFIICFFFYSLVIGFVHFFSIGNLDTRGIVASLFAFVSFFSAYYVNNLTLLRGRPWLIHSINLALFMNNVIILLLFGSTVFNALFYKVIAVNSRIFDYPVPRFSGLLYDGFSYASTLNSIFFGILFYLLLCCRRNMSGLSVYFVILNLLLTFITTVLVGRFGVGIIFIESLILLIFYFYSFKLRARLVLTLKLCFSLFLIFGVVRLFLSLEYAPSISEYFSYGFRFYSNIFVSGEISDSSLTDIRENMFFLPKEWMSIFFGQGNFGRASKYILSDVGFVLGVYGFGIVGVTLFVIGLFTFSHFSIRQVKSQFARISVYLLTSIMILLNLKDFYIFYPLGHFFLFFLFVLLIGNKYADTNR